MDWTQLIFLLYCLCSFTLGTFTKLVYTYYVVVPLFEPVYKFYFFRCWFLNRKKDDRTAAKCPGQSGKLKSQLAWQPRIGKVNPVNTDSVSHFSLWNIKTVQLEGWVDMLFLTKVVGTLLGRLFVIWGENELSIFHLMWGQIKFKEKREAQAG